MFLQYFYANVGTANRFVSLVHLLYCSARLMRRINTDGY